VAVFTPETAGAVKALLLEGHLATSVAGGEGRTLAWFTGFAPYEDTRYAVAVVLEDGEPRTAADIGRGLLAAATARP
jgi:cell division protein FtsI/penicillin-binding protein 2